MPTICTEKYLGYLWFKGLALYMMQVLRTPTTDTE